MISLRKHIETWRDPLAESAVSAYRTALLTMGACGERAVPGIGRAMNEQLAGLHQNLAKPVTPELLAGTSDSVAKELSVWADLAFAHHEDSVREIRGIIQVVARTGDSVALRDEKYGKQLGDLSNRLGELAALDDLPVIRRSILENTRELKACVEKMAEESRESVRGLMGELAEYRTRLEESEKQSATDTLTQLANRRAFEARLEEKIEATSAFCLLMADLNDFKSVNDKYGHMAGDDLLRQFADELRHQFRPTDLVGRWGGDEFAAIIGSAQAEGDVCVDRIRKWVLGDYKIKCGDQELKIPVDAAIGMVQWNGRESAAELMERADHAAYAAKKNAKTSPRGFPGDSRRESDPAALKR